MLVVPADEGIECTLQRLPADGNEVDRRALAGLLGGDAQGAYRWRVRGAGRGAPSACRLYLDGDRAPRRLPPNERATRLGELLSNLDRSRQLLGPVVITGISLGDSDVDIQLAVAMAAFDAGLLATPFIPHSSGSASFAAGRGDSSGPDAPRNPSIDPSVDFGVELGASRRNAETGDHG